MFRVRGETGVVLPNRLIVVLSHQRCVAILERFSNESICLRDSPVLFNYCGVLPRKIIGVRFCVGAIGGTWRTSHWRCRRTRAESGYVIAGKGGKLTIRVFV